MNFPNYELCWASFHVYLPSIYSYFSCWNVYSKFFYYYFFYYCVLRVFKNIYCGTSPLWEIYMYIFANDYSPSLFQVIILTSSFEDIQIFSFAEVQLTGLLFYEWRFSFVSKKTLPNPRSHRTSIFLF